MLLNPTLDNTLGSAYIGGYILVFKLSKRCADMMNGIRRCLAIRIVSLVMSRSAVHEPIVVASLLGVTTLQTYMYYDHSKDDSLRLRTLVSTRRLPHL